MGDGNGIFTYWDGGNLVGDGDLQEEDVWGVVKERSDDSRAKMEKDKALSGSSSSWQLPRGVPRAKSEAKAAQQSSAPVNIPDWSKIYKKKSKKDGSWVNHGDGHDDGADDAHDVDQEEVEEEMVPPHEYIARKLARSQISSFSMCEGIGRTLKGRDLSKVRNAILTKTGFLE